MESDRSLLASI